MRAASQGGQARGLASGAVVEVRAGRQRAYRQAADLTVPPTLFATADEVIE
jgi:hypothetical protein